MSAYDMTRPCDTCPFRRRGGVPLTAERVREIGGMMLSTNGGEFPCHKTVDYDDDAEGVSGPRAKHCAGALIFAEKNETATQMMRIAERLRTYDPRLLQEQDAVCDTLAEMLSVHRSQRRRPSALPPSPPDSPEGLGRSEEQE